MDGGKTVRSTDARKRNRGSAQLDSGRGWRVGEGGASAPRLQLSADGEPVSVCGLSLSFASANTSAREEGRCQSQAISNGAEKHDSEVTGSTSPVTIQIRSKHQVRIKVDVVPELPAPQYLMQIQLFEGVGRDGR